MEDGSDHLDGDHADDLLGVYALMELAFLLDAALGAVKQVAVTVQVAFVANIYRRMMAGKMTVVGSTECARKACIFCGRQTKLTNEHVIPWWATSSEDTKNKSLYIRGEGGPGCEPSDHSRRGEARDLQVKAPCAACNNTWMNNLDNDLATLGPQLIKGKAVRLTKGRQTILANWAVKTMLMLHLAHPRDSRIVIPDADYKQFYIDRQPSNHMLLWAGYMEPLGKNGGPYLAQHEYRHDELSPRNWVQIWPAIGTRTWPPIPLTSAVGLSPLPVHVHPAKA